MTNTLMDDCLRRYLDDIRKTEVVDRDEERRLFEAYKRGSTTARNSLVRSHMRFVSKVAMHFRNTPLPVPDMISEGALGLVKAIETFDTSRDIKFISFAVWWIRSYIVQAIQKKGAMIRLPANQLLRISRENRNQHLGRNTYDPSRRILELKRPDGRKEGGWDKISPNEPREENNPESGILSVRLETSMKAALSQLPYGESFVIRNLYGINQEPVGTMKEVAWDLGLSVERVRQLKVKALENLKANERCTEMRAFLEEA